MKDNNSQLLKFHNFVPSKLEEIKIFLSSNNKIDDISFECFNIEID